MASFTQNGFSEQNNSKKELLFKILVIGDFGVGKLFICLKIINWRVFFFVVVSIGKTSIVRRYAEGERDFFLY